MTINIFKPILFSTEMVQAILAGKKTQTRRIIKIKTTSFFENLSEESIKKHLQSPGAREIYGGYNVGDILWVRETFGTTSIGYMYKASVRSPAVNRPLSGWRPSIHMPKEAARIFLKVTNVRVERLQDITEEDALAEGISEFGREEEFIFYKNYEFPSEYHQDPINSFKSLWDSINAKKHPWKSNPWVWVYEFEKIEKPANCPL